MGLFMKTVLNIVSYNICACADYSKPKDNNGKEIVSVDNTAKVLSSLNADVYGLQEVYMKGPDARYEEQGRRIAEKMAFRHFVYAKGQETDWGNSVDEIGNAVISRFPIVRHEVFSVLKPDESERRPDENDWYEDRVLLETEIALPDGRHVVFMATHFGLNLLEREKIIKTVCERLDKTKLPVILVGDFNARPEGKELTPIYARLTNVAKALGKEENTFASFDPQVILDYIFVSSDIKPVEFRVCKVIASDHYPVFAKLELNG